MADMDMLRDIPCKVSSSLASDEYHIFSTTHELYLRELRQWFWKHLSCWVQELYRLPIRSQCLSRDDNFPMEFSLQQRMVKELDTDNLHAGHSCWQHAVWTSIWQVSIFKKMITHKTKTSSFVLDLESFFFCFNVSKLSKHGSLKLCYYQQCVFTCSQQPFCITQFAFQYCRIKINTSTWTNASQDVYNLLQTRGIENNKLGSLPSLVS